MKTYKIYFVVGEPSGDLLASRLMKALSESKHGNFRFFGVGGETMKAAGFKSLFDNAELAKMGFFEILPSIPRILRRMRQITADMRLVQPDAVVTVDSWSFAFGLIKKIRKDKALGGVPIVHYVAPQVWAWRAGRVRQMAGRIDRLLALLPNEPKLFKDHVPTTFVGHPVLERAVASREAGQEFRAKYGLKAKAEG